MKYWLVVLPRNKVDEVLESETYTAMPFWVSLQITRHDRLAFCVADDEDWNIIGYGAVKQRFTEKSFSFNSKRYACNAECAAPKLLGDLQIMFMDVMLALTGSKRGVFRLGKNEWEVIQLLEERSVELASLGKLDRAPSVFIPCR